MTALPAQARRRVRAAEVVAALSLATDLGMGQPMEFALRTCLLSVRLGEALGVSDADLRIIYYVALLRSAGCTAESPLEANVFGDEIAARVWLSALDFGRPTQVLGALARHVGADEPPLHRVRRLGNALAALPSLASIEAAHCEVAEQLAASLSLSVDAQRAVGDVFERWDGHGLPRHRVGEAIALAARVVSVAFDATLFHGLGGSAAATAVVRQRARGKYDPRIADAFCRQADHLLAAAEMDAAWQETLDIEPDPHVWLADSQLEPALGALGAFADLVSPYLAGHSRAVAELATSAATWCHLPAAECASVRLAGLVHDVGRAGVSAGIWNKSGALATGERERVRLHAYFTERILARVSGLGELADMAALHHERLDGSGYHRRAPAAAQPMLARVLAAADVYCALREARPHRAAHTPGTAAGVLRTAVESGQLDGDAVQAVLGAVGNRPQARRRSWPAGLSDREVDVLRLLARGLSNRQIGATLSVSPRTAGNHIQHIYDKLGVSTRPAATLFAIQHDLLGTLPAQEMS